MKVSPSKSLVWFLSGITPSNSDKGKLYCKVFLQDKGVVYLHSKPGCCAKDVVARGAIKDNNTTSLMEISIDEMNGSGVHGSVKLHTNWEFIEELVMESEFEIPLANDYFFIGVDPAKKYVYDADAPSGSKFSSVPIPQESETTEEEVTEEDIKMLIEKSNPNMIEKLKNVLLDKSKKPKKKKRRGRRILP